MFISVDAVRWVLTESASERSARLVFIAIAAHCNEDGYAWPGLEAIERYSKLSRPKVLQSIETLVELKEITVERGGHGARDTNRYFLSVFMARVNKGKENGDKGKETAQKESTRVYTNKNLEQESLEQATIDSPEYKEKIKAIKQRVVDWQERRWQEDEQGKYLISPSSGQKVYEENVA
jgi:hypothetical protein